MKTPSPLRFAFMPRAFQAGGRYVPSVAWFVLALTVLAGCGRESPPAMVEGTLRLDGQPLERCLVTFLPEGDQDAQGQHSKGLTDEQGYYRLRYDDQREVAAVGPHRVTVQDLTISTGIRRRDHGTVDAEQADSGPSAPVRRSRVSERYSSPVTTPLRIEVKARPQTVDLDVE
jgi:hypothetical protein